MKSSFVRGWHRVRAFALSGLALAFGSSAFAEGGSNSYAPDFTEATTAITAVSSGIVSWIQQTVLGKVIAVSVCFVVLSLVVKVIRYFARGK